MDSKQLSAPIPGMSLTREKGNAPWEQPPLYTKPEEALAFYLERLEDEEQIEDILFTLDQGLPLSVLVDSMMSYGVMEGYHSIDVKMLVAPVIHEHLLALGEAAGINVIENAGPTKEERMKEKEKKRILMILEESLGDAEGDEGDVGEAKSILEMEDPTQPEQPEVMSPEVPSQELPDQPTKKPVTGGLIPRGV